MIEKNKRNNNILIIGVLIIFTICLLQLNMASVIPTAANVNDKTIEGLDYKNKNIRTVQFHPEACPGPQDTAYLFDEFMDRMKGAKNA